MIDIENIVVSNVTKAVRAEYLSEHPKLVVYSYDQPIPESFPCVTVVATDNYTYRASRTLGKYTENHANVTFTINVYTDNAEGSKALAKGIFSTADAEMQSMGFTRIYAAPTANIDRTIYRIVGRYSAIVGEGMEQTIDGEDALVFPVHRN